MPIRSLTRNALAAGLLLPLTFSGCRSTGCEGRHESRIYLPSFRLPWVPPSGCETCAPGLTSPPVTALPPGTSWHYSEPIPVQPPGPGELELAEPPASGDLQFPPEPSPYHNVPSAPPSEAVPPPELPGPALENAPSDDELLEDEYEASRGSTRRYGRTAALSRATANTPQERRQDEGAGTPRMFDSIGANVRGMFDAVRSRLPGGGPDVSKAEPKAEESDELTPESRESIAKMFEKNGRPAIARQFRDGVQDPVTTELQPQVSSQRPTLIPPQRNGDAVHESFAPAPVTPASRTTDHEDANGRSSGLARPFGDDSASFWGHSLSPGASAPTASTAAPALATMGVPVKVRSKPVADPIFGDLSEPGETSLPLWPNKPREIDESEPPIPFPHSEVSAARYRSQPPAPEPQPESIQTLRNWSTYPEIEIVPGPRM